MAASFYGRKSRKQFHGEIAVPGSLTAAPIVQTARHRTSRPPKSPFTQVLAPARKHRGRSVPATGLTDRPRILDHRFAKPKTPPYPVLMPARKHRDRYPGTGLTAAPLVRTFWHRLARQPKLALQALVPHRRRGRSLPATGLTAAPKIPGHRISRQPKITIPSLLPHRRRGRSLPATGLTDRPRILDHRLSRQPRLALSALLPRRHRDRLPLLALTSVAAVQPVRHRTARQPRLALQALWPRKRRGWLSGPGVPGPTLTIIFRASTGTSNGPLGSGPTTSIAINAPAGSFLIAAIDVEGGTNTTITPPDASWHLLPTQGRIDSTTVLSQAVYYHVGMLSGAQTWTFGNSVNNCGVIRGYDNVDPNNPINVSAGQANASSTSDTAPSVTPTMTGTELVEFWGSDGKGNWTFPGGFGHAQSIGSGVTGTPTIGAADQALATTNPTGTEVATNTVAKVNIGHSVVLQPAPLIVLPPAMRKPRQPRPLPGQVLVPPRKYHHARIPWGSLIALAKVPRHRVLGYTRPPPSGRVRRKRWVIVPTLRFAQRRRSRQPLLPLAFGWRKRRGRYPGTGLSDRVRVLDHRFAHPKPPPLTLLAPARRRRDRLPPPQPVFRVLKRRRADPPPQPAPQAFAGRKRRGRVGQALSSSPVQRRRRAKQVRGPSLFTGKRRRGRLPLLNLVGGFNVRRRTVRARKAPPPFPARHRRRRVPKLALIAAPVKRRQARRLLLAGAMLRKRVRSFRPLRVAPQIPVILRHKKADPAPSPPPAKIRAHSSRGRAKGTGLIAAFIVYRHRQPHLRLMPPLPRIRARYRHGRVPGSGQTAYPQNRTKQQRLPNAAPPSPPVRALTTAHRRRGRVPNPGWVMPIALLRHSRPRPGLVQKPPTTMLCPPRKHRFRGVNLGLGTPIAVLIHRKARSPKPAPTPGRRRRARIPFLSLFARPVSKAHRFARARPIPGTILVPARKRRGRFGAGVPVQHRRKGTLPRRLPPPAISPARKRRGRVPNLGILFPVAFLRNRARRTVQRGVALPNSALMPSRKRRGRFPGTGRAAFQVVLRHRETRPGNPQAQLPILFLKPTGRRHRYPGTGQAGKQLVLRHRKAKPVLPPPTPGRRRRDRVPLQTLIALAKVPRHGATHRPMPPTAGLVPARKHRARPPQTTPFARKHRTYAPKPPPRQAQAPARKRRGRLPLSALVARPRIPRHKVLRPIDLPPRARALWAQGRRTRQRWPFYPVGPTFAPSRVIVLAGSVDTTIALGGSLVDTTISLTGSMFMATRTDFTFFRGERLILRYGPIANGGASIGGYTFHWRLKRYPLDPNPILFKDMATGVQITDATNNYVQVTVNGGDNGDTMAPGGAQPLPPGAYFADLVRIDAGAETEVGYGEAVLSIGNRW